MPASPTFDASLRRLRAKTLALFLSYLAVAMSMPVISLHVVRQLHYGNARAGLAVGICFFTTIVTRSHAGRFADLHGGKPAMLRGLVLYTLAGLIGLLSCLPGLPAWSGYLLLLLGRLILGAGESLTLVGMIAWGIGLMGQAHSGKVLSLVGMGMYGAFALGGPIGLIAYQHSSFPLLMALCSALPAAGWLLASGFPAIAPPEQSPVRRSFRSVVGIISKQGAAVGLQGIGFAVLGAFFALYCASRHWAAGEWGLTGFGAGFVAVRLLCGHLPDRIGGYRVALVSLLIEACGQYCIWLAPSASIALLGAVLSGIGCSMVFPAMGVEAMRRVPPDLRASAVGGFAAFQDLAYGLSGPIAGLIADRSGYASVFLIGALAASLGLLITWQASIDHQPPAIPG
jgi:MFS family permease